MQIATAPATSHVMVLYRVVDMLVDGYFPVLAAFDDQIDDLEDEILQAPTDEQLGRLFDMKRALIVLRKVVTPERDVFATLVSSADVIPGMTPDYERYFRDVYDHLIRVSDLVDSYRDLLSGALDTHLSTVSNRLNVVMKQLTIIATVFLPLSFLTGFFGQNFGWMIGRITSLSAFWFVGVGSQIVVATALLIMFRRRGWLSPDGTVPAAVPARVAPADVAYALAGAAPDQVHVHRDRPSSGPVAAPATDWLRSARPARLRPAGLERAVAVLAVRPGALAWSAKPIGTGPSSDGSRPGR